MTNKNSKIKCNMVFEMDCEAVPFTGMSYHPGPKSWAESKKNIKAFVNLLISYNITPVLFAVPEVTKRHKILLIELKKKGCEVGLHLHPNKNLGLLAYDKQYKLISIAKKEFESNLKFSPKIFKGGYYSANRETFKVLSSLGFTYTSTSVARRNIKRTGAQWANFPSTPYFTEGIFELPVSSHPFKNLPILSFELRSFFRKIFISNNNFGRSYKSHFKNIAEIIFKYLINKNNNADTHPLDLQVEHRDIVLLKDVIKANINYFIKHDINNPCLVCTTHNDVPFGRKRNRFIKRLEGVIKFVNSIKEVDFRFSTIRRLPKETYILLT